MYFLNEVVTKIVQRNFQCKHTAIFITLTSLSIPECLQTATRSQWNSIFRERSIITPWNNSWTLTNSLKTISLSVFQLLPKLIAYTVHRMSFFRYQVLCLLYLAISSLCRICIILSMLPRHLHSDLWGTVMNQPYLVQTPETPDCWLSSPLLSL